MQNTTQNLTFWANETFLPGVDIGTIPVRHWGYGAAEKRPFVPQFGECQIGFYCDAKAQQWTFFKQWLNFIVGFDTSQGITTATAGGVTGSTVPYEATYKEDYMTTIYIQTFSDDGTLVNSIGLNEVYPISMSNVRLDWAVTDQIAKFNVAFTYRDWFQTTTPGLSSIGATAD